MDGLRNSGVGGSVKNQQMKSGPNSVSKNYFLMLAWATGNLAIVEKRRNYEMKLGKGIISNEGQGGKTARTSALIGFFMPWHT